MLTAHHAIYAPVPRCGVCGLLEKHTATGPVKGAGEPQQPTTISHTLHISHAFWVRRKSTGSQRRVNLLHSEVRFEIRWWAALQLV